jgi:glycerophosphoryl diester phosphodiesterase
MNVGISGIIVSGILVAGLIGATTLQAAPANAGRDDSWDDSWDDSQDDPWRSRRVLDVAHAGGDLEAPHSTLFAMKQAVAAGADVVEMDVRLSSDDVLVVQHDDTVDRTTNGTGAVADMTVEELQALDNGYWFVPDCWSCHDRGVEEYQYRGVRTGERAAPAGYEPDDFTIPTLEQVATAFPTRVLDIEIKDGPDGMAAADALAAFIATHGREDRYLVASFSDEIMTHFKSVAPTVATSPGLNETIQWFGTREAMPHHKVLQVPPIYSGIEVVTQQFVDDAHDDGLAVWVWFNGNDDDQALEWQRLVDLGVDALLTGKPRAAQSLLRATSMQFRTAPVVASNWQRNHNTASGVYACPAVHVARCRSVAVLVTFDRHGRAHLGGVAAVTAPRGEQRSVRIRLLGAGHRADRALLLLFRANDDTAHAVVDVALHT